MKVVHNNQMPARVGLGWFFVYYLFLEHVNAPMWVYGVVFTLLSIVSLSQLFKLFTQKQTLLNELN